MPDYPSGTVAFLFTDVEGSTRLWETWRDAMAAAVDRHFAILDASVSAQHGVLFKKVGDACQAAFATVPAAVAAAIAAQLALRQEDWGELEHLRVRMAIHVGDATPVNGDYLAPALNRLARALASGHGEQILLTSAARSLAVDLPAGYALRSLGQYRLRDLLEAETIYQVAGPGLTSEFPPLNTLDQHHTNLPLQPTPFIGREGEIEALAELLTASQTRLVTLIGPGGSGKTRLALQVAAELLDDFPDGVWWLPLAAISDPGLFIQAIAGPLGVRENPGQALRDTLAEYLRNRKSLLILDNLEQLIDAADDIRALLDAAPGLVVLATSREPLRLRGEREFPVAPLPLPEPHARTTAEEALSYPAIRLFVDRARAVKPSFQLDATTVADVVAVCRRLDGLPLAIELAAARIRILSPAALLARLDRRLTVLTGGARDLPARQQTLRATIAWSYDLLDPQEQELFARLGVFVGGWTFEAGEAVCSAAGGLPLDLIDGLDSLVQKSLVRQDDVPGGDVRFTMLETVREFAQERFQELPAAEELRAVHAAWFLALAENANWDDFAAQADVLIRLEAEHANFRQTIAYFEGQGAGGVSARARLAAALSYFWWLRGYLTEGRSVLERVIAERDAMPTADCAAALSGVAFLVEAQGDMEQAEAFQEEALALYRTLGDSEGIGRALAALGAISRQRGDLAMARARLQEGLEAWRATGDVAGTAGALMELGLVRQLEGAYAEAVPQLQEALRLFRQIHDHMGEAHALNRLGLLAMSTGELADAVGHFAESLRLWRAMGNQQMLAADLHNLGEAHHLSGALDEAEARYREALTLFEEIGDLRGRGFAYCHLGLLALDRGDLAEADRLLRQSLRLRWDAGFRASMTDTLEALAETTWKLGDVRLAATMLRASAQLRAETGLAQQPVYEERYRHVSEAVSSVTLAEPLDLEQFIGSLTRSAPYATLLTA